MAAPEFPRGAGHDCAEDERDGPTKDLECFETKFWAWLGALGPSELSRVAELLMKTIEENMRNPDCPASVRRWLFLSLLNSPGLYAARQFTGDVQDTDTAARALPIIDCLISALQEMRTQLQ